MENYLMINGKKITLTEEQVKILSDEEDIWNPEYGDNYYWIDNTGDTCCFPWMNEESDQDTKKVANCCTDEALMQKRALVETLNRLLWRFALQNGWNDKFIKETHSEKVAIYYNISDNEFRFDYPDKCVYSNIIFISREIAQRAIDEIIKPFIEQHPEMMKGD